MAKRIISLDIFKAMLIAFVIFLHPLVQRVFNQEAGAFEDIFKTLPIPVIILLAPIAIFSLWGTAFLLISGAASAYQVFKKLEIPSEEFTHITKQRLLNAVLVYAFHFMFVTITSNFTSNEHPISTYSLLTGSLELGYFTPFNGLMFLTSSVLEAIALSNIMITLIFHVINRRKITDPKKIIKIFAYLTIGIFAVAIVMAKITPSPYAIPYPMWDDKNYIGYYIYMHLFSTRFAFFPCAGFACLGVIIGIYFAQERTPKQLFKLWGIVASLSLVYFVIELLLQFDLIGAFALDYVAVPIHALNIALQVFFLLIIWLIFDHKAKKLPNFVNGVVGRYSNTTLTIFLIEPLISINIKNLFVTIWGSTVFDELFPYAIIFEVLIMSLWFVLLWLWDTKAQLKFSMEWIIGKAKLKTR